MKMPGVNIHTPLYVPLWAGETARSSECLVLLLRTRVLFPEVRQLITICDQLLGPSVRESVDAHIHMPASTRTRTTQNIKINLKKKRKISTLPEIHQNTGD